VRAETQNDFPVLLKACGIDLWLSRKWKHWECFPNISVFLVSWFKQFASVRHVTHNFAARGELNSKKGPKATFLMQKNTLILNENCSKTHSDMHQGTCITLTSDPSLVNGLPQ